MRPVGPAASREAGETEPEERYFWNVDATFRWKMRGRLSATVCSREDVVLGLGRAWRRKVWFGGIEVPVRAWEGTAPRATVKEQRTRGRGGKAECLRAVCVSVHEAPGSARRWVDPSRWALTRMRLRSAGAVTAGQNRSRWRRSGIPTTGAAGRPTAGARRQASAPRLDRRRTAACAGEGEGVVVWARVVGRKSHSASISGPWRPQFTVGPKAADGVKLCNGALRVPSMEDSGGRRVLLVHGGRVVKGGHRTDKTQARFMQCSSE